MITTLDDLADVARWVAWRNERRGEKLAKVPYIDTGRKAQANNPGTWLTRRDAEVCAGVIANGLGGGTGIMLGDLGEVMKATIFGIDLDTCRDPATRTFDRWAAEVIYRFDSYTEISPSGTGAKIFALISDAALNEVHAATEIKYGKTFARRGGTTEHPPAIEVHIGNRYFAVTGQQLEGAPAELTPVPPRTLLWLLCEYGPAFARADSGNAKGRSRTGGTDKSRSAIAFRKGTELRRAGKTYEEMCEALRTDPETAEWTRSNGEANGQRELQRIWDKAEAVSEVITVRAGLRHEAADAGLAALHAAGVPFFQRDQSIVRVCMAAAKTASGEATFTPAITEVGFAFLNRALGQVARWEKFDQHGKPVRIDPPAPVVEQIGNMAGEWPFPVLAGVIGTPTMRPDGSLQLAEGYDESTGFVLLGAPAMLPIPEKPTRAQAEAALRLIEGRRFVDFIAPDRPSICYAPTGSARWSNASCHRACRYHER